MLFFHKTKLFAGFVAIMTVLTSSIATAESAAEAREFGKFSVTLPEKWDGEEQEGFVSGNPEEYQLTIGRMNDAKDEFLAQVSVYILPNKTGTDSKEAVLRLAEAQGGASKPEKKGNFWIFTGEPRTNVLSGIATTMVNANPKKMLIIIVQDPKNLGGTQIVESLRGITSEAKELLGR